MIEGLNANSLEPMGMETTQVLSIELASTYLRPRPFPGLTRLTSAARYRTLVEQIPAVTFMAFLDQGLTKHMSVLTSRRCRV